MSASGGENEERRGAGQPQGVFCLSPRRARVGERRFVAHSLQPWKVLKPDADTVEWQCVAGPGHSVGTVARFQLSLSDGGRTLVEFSHAGWPDADDNLRKCNTLWAILLFHLKKYLEVGKAAPAFS